jgi:cytochrome b subunit of formate dehydrogenase
MDEMTIYWITRFDTVKNALEFLSIISFIISAATGVTSFIASFDRDMMFDTDILRNFKLTARISFICFAIFGFMYCFMPSTKEMFAIKCIPAIVSKENVEKFKDISDNMLDATATYIKDLKKK